MKLSKIRAINFGTINEQPETLQLKDFNLFIGKNNTGKSTLLRLIPLLDDIIQSREAGHFGDTFTFRPSWRTRHKTENIDAFFHNQSKNFTVEYHFNDLTLVLEIRKSDENTLEANLYTNGSTVSNPHMFWNSFIEDNKLDISKYKIIKPIRKAGIEGKEGQELDIDGTTAVKILEQLITSRNQFQRDKFKKLKKGLRQLMLPNLTDIIVDSDKMIYLEEGDSLPIPLSKYGAGVENILLILIEVLNANPESVISIEEPEAHLHPTLLKDLVFFCKKRLHTSI